VTLTVADGRLVMRRAPAPAPAAVLTGDVAAVRSLVYRRAADAPVRIDGDRGLARRLVECLAG
jgi:hypothetical protein